ncbi:Phenylalanine 2-monooxygenase precursor [Pseudolycoriella hygida]|uniref:Phenylalanine 2-monooxygenase n=1 Tax=Pseudolycoriella hygida TaxID=35572 RepID=A0A9Q0MM02_9DIPT|nr:Phenylalanine 2-monooxygenase precursor [Pseudolycoriella hygida]
MGISINPDVLFTKRENKSRSRTIVELAENGKYYRHPDSSLISYPVVVEKPLGEIKKDLNVAIVGAGPAGIACLYELSRLKGEGKITVTMYDCDPDHFQVPEEVSVRIKGLKAGRVSAAISSEDEVDRAVYEIGAMRFPEIAGLVWHYAYNMYPDKREDRIDPFPNPGTVPTELLHGNYVDRYGPGKEGTDWLHADSRTKQVVELIGKRLKGTTDKDKNTSLFPIGGKDPAKISQILKDPKTQECELKTIHEHWKTFMRENDISLESAIRKIIETYHDELKSDVPGISSDVEKINYYVELFGTIGFGTGGFKPVYNMSLLETMRLMLWSYNDEYLLPVQANVHFFRDIYLAALENGRNRLKINTSLARVSDVCHVEENGNVKALVVSYKVEENGAEHLEAKTAEYDYVILTTTPKQTSSMISKVGFRNKVVPSALLGEPMPVPDDKSVSPKSDKCKPSVGQVEVKNVRPALVLSNDNDIPNSKLFTAVNNLHMVCSSKVFATVKITDFEKYAPKFKENGPITAIVADCGLGSSYVVPYVKLTSEMEDKSNTYYSFLISYAWEDDSKGLQNVFGKYPLNVKAPKPPAHCPGNVGASKDTEHMMRAVIRRTMRRVTDPIDGSDKQWWFGEALRNCTLEDQLSYDWGTNNSAGAFKLNMVGDNHNADLLVRYHTHALTPKLNNRFFLANCSYSHLGGWLEGAFMSAVNAVCGLVVAANDGNVDALSPEARKVVESFESVV